MAKVDLTIGGNSYSLACRDGEEPHLTHVAALVDEKTQQARKGLGSVSEVRQLLFASLLLADELDEARRKSSGAPAKPEASAAPTEPTTAPAKMDEADLILLEDIASRLESLAERLEQRG